MSRTPHLLNENKRKEKPRYMIFMDSESRVIDNEHKPYLICATFLDTQTGRREEKVYKGPQSLGRFWRQAVRFGGKRKQKVYIYAHNMFYDLTVTGGIKHVCREGFRVNTYFEKGSTFILNFVKKGMVWNKEKTRKVERTQKSITCISTTNYFAESLASLAKSFNLEKLDYEYNTGSMADAITYCKRDVEIIETAVLSLIDFIQQEDLGTFAKTLPGQSFNAYRHRFMTSNIFIHDNEAAIKLEREAYSGGRVECFKIGTFTNENFYYYDVNSMYPYVMKENLYPAAVVSGIKQTSIKYLKQLIDNGLLLVARCRIKTQEPLFAVKLGSGLIFPVGEFNATLTTPELILAFDRGLVLETFEAALYKADYLFVDFVDYFYTKRQEAKSSGDKMRDKLYKLILNSLYGKFGQKSEEWTRIRDAPIDKIQVMDRLDAETGEWTNFKTFGGSVFQKQAERESFNSFPAIAAHVTAYARNILLNFIEIAGWENVYYSDTDSLIVNEAGHQNLLPYHNEKTLGMIKEENRGRELIINCPKDYSFAGKTKRKGVRKGSKQIDEITFNTQVWPKLNSCLRTGTLAGYRNIDRVKVLTRAYTKGWVDMAGNVFPFELKIENEENKMQPPEIKCRDFLYTVQGKTQTMNQKEIIKRKYKKYLSDNW